MTIIHTMPTSDDLDQKLKAMTTEYEVFCGQHNLPNESADELLFHDDLTDEQRRWLQHFIEQWVAVEDQYQLLT
jgi:hypothetical protein